MSYKIIDNFLPVEDFKRLQKLVMYDVPWFFQPQINAVHTLDDNTSYFTHILYDYEGWPQLYSDYFRQFKILSDRLKIVSLIRMKLNLYPKTEKIEMHHPHIDYEMSHKACVLSFNTCNGNTLLYDEQGNYDKIESIENRAVLFDASKNHASTSCTNAKARWNVNINYV